MRMTLQKLVDLVTTVLWHIFIQGKPKPKHIIFLKILNPFLVSY